MEQIENTIEIARSVEEVFAYVTTPEHWADWSNPVIAVRAPESGQLQPDATFTVVARLLGRQFDSPSRVTGFEANRLLSYESTSGPLPSTFIWRFEKTAGGTRLTQTIIGDEERTSGFFKLAFPLVKTAVGRQTAADLATLKDLLETKA